MKENTSSTGPTKGLDNNFGLHRNRPFYFRSRLPMKRLAEAIGASSIKLKRWRKGAKAQQFFFDPVSKTIRSNHWKGRSLDIASSGRSANLQIYTTNSRWF